VEPERSLDPLDFLRKLHASEIRCLLVGRQAMVLLGAPVLSADYDFYMSPEAEDLEAMLSLARDLDLEVSPKNPSRRPFFSLLSDTLKLDFFRARRYSIPGGATFTFEEIFERRRVVPVDDFAVYVPTVRDLIRTKMVRGLPKDQEDIKYLQALLERGEA
jgi:hypothetical protein